MGKILVIEDSLQQHELIKRAFLRYDDTLEVITVSSVSEGFDVLENEDLDIIFVDYVLQEMNGVQFLKELKKNSIDIPTVLITARGDERTAVEAIKAGAYEYVIKDIGYFNALPHVYKKVMEEHSARRALSKAHRRILEFNENLLRINNLIQSLNEELDTTETVRKGLSGGVDLLGGDGGFICLCDNDKIVEFETENIEIAPPECSLIKKIEGILLLEDLSPYPEIEKVLKGYSPAVVLIAPFRLSGGLNGVFAVVFLQEPSIGDEQINAFRLYLDALTSAVNNSLLFEQVARSQTLWQVTFDAISDILFVVDERGIVQKCNRAFAEDCGLHPREIVGAPLLKICGKSNIMKMYLDLNLGEKREYFSQEVSYHEKRFIISGFPVVFPDGTTAMVNIVKDITETSRLKEQLFHADKLASLGLLVSGVAHEINNPLTGIVGYTELLQMKVKDEDIQRELAKIANAADRCKTIVENLLAFSRQKEPEKTYTMINDIIDGAVELRAYWLRSNNVEVVREYGELPYAYVDPQQIQQVILNLLINAEHALEEVDRDQKRVIFRTAHNKDAGTIQIWISDNGTGIPADVIPRIFDPFFTTKPVNKGSGLGLSISHGIVKENGGTIHLEETSPEGTTFYIELPVKQP
ncbi:MAG: hybrid sensor histidine kinase/response regulator [Nitrospirae bacterium]|nr:MAG: hybrid sensor histidine kinase/response regulator [Nitrospirota bacterium]